MKRSNAPDLNDVIVNPQVSDPVGPDGGKNADESEEVDCDDDGGDGDGDGDGQIRLDEQIKNVFKDEQVGDLSDLDERFIGWEISLTIYLMRDLFG